VAALAPLEIHVPEPCLVVLVGAAGSGKTTLAARLFAPEQVLSSDAYRGIVAGDEADQSVTGVAFRLLHRDLERRLAARLTTVVDATNTTSFARRSLTRIAERHGVPAVAIVLDLPAELILARNATRDGRIVPEAAVRRQLADLERSLRRDDIARAGFVAWHVLRHAGDLDRLRRIDR
jgi:protein phosphatase